MYCYRLSWILPLSGAGQCCPNMPIMTLPACISPHRTQVFHLVITSSLIHGSDWLLITTLTSDWLIAQDMIRRPIAGYLNQTTDNWCRCRVSWSVWWVWWWLWSHQGPVPPPGPSWSSYSWDLLHQDEGFAESWRRKIKLVTLLATLHDSLQVFVLLETICAVQHPAVLQSLQDAAPEMADGWVATVYTQNETSRPAVVTGSRHKTSAMSRCQKIN